MYKQKRYIIYAINVAMVFLISATFLGCFVGYTLTENQDSEPIEKGKSTLTFGSPDIRYQVAVSEKDEIGVSLWSVNLPTYIIKPNKYYDIGLKLNWKHSFLEEESRSMLALLVSGFVYKAFVTEISIDGNDDASNKIRYQGFGIVPGIIYSYKFKDYEEETEEKYPYRFPLWILHTHSIYGGIKLNGLYGQVSKYYSWDAHTESVYRKNLFLAPFIGLSGGTENKRMFIEINSLFGLNNGSLTFNQVPFIGGGFSYVFDLF